MNMKRCLLISLFLSVFVSLHAQGTDEVAIKQKISEVSASIQTMRCDFVQTKQLKMLNDKMVSRGLMYYQQGNRLRWEYVSPYTYTFTLNDSKVMVGNSERSDVLDVNQSNVFKEVVRIMMDCMTGTCLTDERDFGVVVSDSGAEWLAELTPQRKELRKLFRTIVLHFDVRSALVSMIELVENNGDNTLIELKNLKTNIPLDAEIFDIN